jgi:hypothetical protein
LCLVGEIAAFVSQDRIAGDPHLSREYAHEDGAYLSPDPSHFEQLLRCLPCAATRGAKTAILGTEPLQDEQLLVALGTLSHRVMLLLRMQGKGTKKFWFCMILLKMDDAKRAADGWGEAVYRLFSHSPCKAIDGMKMTKITKIKVI